jgi:acetolactate synthase regulatory subunit
MELSYRDREGVLRRVLSEATGMGYVISDLDVARSDADRGVVAVRFEIEGRRSVDDLVEGLQSLDGVVEVRAGESAE